MNLGYTQCCAVREIANLSGHPSALDAMKAFCKQIWDPAYNGNPTSKLHGHFIFTGVVKHTDGSKITRDGKYGPEFAAYIKKHSLGDVVESKAASNRVNHPSHLVKVWVWSPHPVNLKKWYAKNTEAKNGLGV